MMRREYNLRIDATTVCAHPVVIRARVSMEMAREELGKGFHTSALAGSPDGWLDAILSRTHATHGIEDKATTPMDFQP